MGFAPEGNVMKRILPASALALCFLLVQGAGKAFAQAGPFVQPGPGGYSQYGYGSPRLSPYLNLLRGGNTAANYYMGVVPEVERRANARLFSSQILDLNRRLQGVEEEKDLFPRLSETGHPAGFMTYGPYFNMGTQRRPTTGAIGQPHLRR